MPIPEIQQPLREPPWFPGKKAVKGSARGFHFLPPMFLPASFRPTLASSGPCQLSLLLIICEFADTTQYYKSKWPPPESTGSLFLFSVLFAVCFPDFNRKELREHKEQSIHGGTRSEIENRT